MTELAKSFQGGIIPAKSPSATDDFREEGLPGMYPSSGKRLPEISNNVGSVKLFMSALLRSPQRVSLFVVFFGPVDD
ncbi:MAG: hypothetical protein WA714_06300, partial [Candidatus Acidiferrales bacterium]